jgi:CheY-like chemotaxis protein
LIADLLRAIAAVAWPVITAVLVWRLYPVVRSIAQSRAFKVKVAGMEISVQQASEQLQAQLDDLRAKLSEVRGAVDKTSVAVEPHVASKRVLWVDDQPVNNAYAIAQLRDRGYEVIQALSTSEGMRVLASATPPVAAVISDMAREEAGTYRPDAGLELLAAMRAANHRQPFIVCTTAEAARHYDGPVRAGGGSGATTSLVEVFEFVRGATGTA